MAPEKSQPVQLHFYNKDDTVGVATKVVVFKSPPLITIYGHRGMHIPNCARRQALGPIVTTAFFIMSHFSPVGVGKPFRRPFIILDFRLHAPVCYQ